MTGPTANLKTLAYRSELSTVGNTSVEPPGTPCGPRTISPIALAIGIAASTASVRCNRRRLLLLCCVTTTPHTDRVTCRSPTLHDFAFDVNLSIYVGYDHRSTRATGCPARTRGGAVDPPGHNRQRRHRRHRRDPEVSRREDPPQRAALTERLIRSCVRDAGLSLRAASTSWLSRTVLRDEFVEVLGDLLE